LRGLDDLSVIEEAVAFENEDDAVGGVLSAEQAGLLFDSVEDELTAPTLAKKIDCFDTSHCSFSW